MKKFVSVLLISIMVFGSVVPIFGLNLLYDDYSSMITALNNTNHQFIDITNLSNSSTIYGLLTRCFSDCMALFDDSLSLTDGYYSPYLLMGDYPMYAFAFIDYFETNTDAFRRCTLYFYNNPVHAVNGVIDGSDMLMGCSYTHRTSTGAYNVYKSADFYNDDVTFITTSGRYYLPIGVFGIDDNYYAIEGYTDQFVTPFIPVPDLPNYPNGNGNTYNPDANSGQVNWPNFVYMIASWFFYNGVMNTNIPGQSQTVNYPGTVGIGSALTYDFLCKVNMGNSTVSYQGNDYPNYLFQLSELMYMIDESLGSFADSLEDAEIGTSLSTINNNIQELTDGFNELYPEDARNMVTEIEDEIYDSENGGISISTMQDALSIKNTADESFDTGYSLTEGITGLFGWSSDSEGWGFWSTAVQNDLDSPVNASLMEDDIVDFINSKDGEIDRKLGILNVSD